MRRVVGTILGFASIIVGVVLPIFPIAGISGMIWGCRVFSGPQAETDPARHFFVAAIILTIPISTLIFFYFVSLPIFAIFGVRVVSRRRDRNDQNTLAMVRSARALASRYVTLLDKLIEQENV